MTDNHTRDKTALYLIVEAAPLFEKFEQIDGESMWGLASETFIQCGPMSYLNAMLSSLALKYWVFTNNHENSEKYRQQLADWQDWFHQVSTWEEKYSKLLKR